MDNKISIITPSFNQGKFIKETINSVLNQKNCSIEYIINDACSTDNTGEILKEYNGKLIYNIKKDKGQADAVNNGIKSSNNQVIGWINSDDIYYENAFDTVIKFFDENKQANIVYGEADHIDENGNCIEDYPTNENFDINLLKEVCFICQPAVFFRRKIFNNYGYLNENLQYCMDYDFWLRIAKLEKFFFIKKKLAGSRLYQQNKTLLQSKKVHFEISENFKKIFNEVPPKWIFALANHSTDVQNQFRIFDIIRLAFKYEFFFHKKLRLSFLISPFDGSFEKWSAQSGVKSKNSSKILIILSRILNLIYIPFHFVIKGMILLIFENIIKIKKFFYQLLSKKK